MRKSILFTIFFVIILISSNIAFAQEGTNLLLAGKKLQDQKQTGGVDLKQYEMSVSIPLPPPLVTRKPRIKDCNEGDKGDNPFEWSNLIFGFKDEAPKFLEDKCIDTNNLKEVYCDGNKEGQSKTYYCPSFGEKICLEGACIDKPIELKTEIPIPKPPQLAQETIASCIDSDKGIEPKLTGYAQIFEFGKIIKEEEDHCEPPSDVSGISDVLNEKYCKNGKIETEKIGCSFWVEVTFPEVSKTNFGFCNKDKKICDLRPRTILPKEETKPKINEENLKVKCIDTDPKDEPAQKGFVDGISSGKIVTLPDTCEGKYELRQAYCNDKNEPEYYKGTIYCPEYGKAYGVKSLCNDGICSFEDLLPHEKPEADKEIITKSKQCIDTDPKDEPTQKGFVDGISSGKIVTLPDTCEGKYELRQAYCNDKNEPEYYKGTIYCPEYGKAYGVKSLCNDGICSFEDLLPHEKPEADEETIDTGGGITPGGDILKGEKQIEIPQNQELKNTWDLLKKIIDETKKTNSDVSGFINPLSDIIKKNPRLDPQGIINSKVNEITNILNKLNTESNAAEKLFNDILKAQTEEEIEKISGLVSLQSRYLVNLQTDILSRTEEITGILETQSKELNKALEKEREEREKKKEETQKVLKNAEEEIKAVLTELDDINKIKEDINSVLNEVNKLQNELSIVTGSFLRVTGRATENEPISKSKKDETIKMLNIAVEKANKARGVAQTANTKVEDAKKEIEKGNYDNAILLINDTKKLAEEAKKLALESKDNAEKAKNLAKETRLVVKKEQREENYKKIDEDLAKIGQKRGILKKILDNLLNNLLDLKDRMANIF